MDGPIAVGETVADVDATLVRPAGTAEEVPLGDLVADRPVLLSFYTLDFTVFIITGYRWVATTVRRSTGNDLQ